MKKICLAMAAAAIAASAMADNQVFHLANSLKLGYDDNVYLRDTDKQDSFRIIESVDVRLNLNLERTYLGIRYNPALSWYADREDDKTDVLHNVTFNWIQDLAPRLKLDVSDSLRAGQLPELYDEDGYVVRQDNDNYYNSARASLLYQLTEKTRIDASGRYILLNYSDDGENDAHRYDNYDSWVAGLTLRQVLASRTTAMADVRYQGLKYDHSLDGFCRDADMIFAGLGLEQTFSREIIGSLRAGVERRSYDTDDYDDQTKPYVEASLTLMPSPATRFTLTGSYSITESDIGSYLSQERLYCSISAAHDFTSRLSAYLTASYAKGDYDGEYSFTKNLPDVTEDSYTAGARIAYKVLENHWFEIGYHFLKLESDSDARESYADNRFDLGWKWQIR